MSCCGQKRQAWRQLSKPAIQPAVLQPPALQNPVLLRHMGTSSLVIKGAATGITYLFAGQESNLAVDERDAPALTATGLFTRQD